MKTQYFVLALTLVLGGCLKTRAELDAEASGQQQEKQTVSQQRSAAGQAPVKEKAPPSGYRFEEIDEQLRALTGRVDVLENSMAQIKTVKQTDKDLEAKDKQTQDQKFVAYEEALKKLELQIAALSEDVAKLKAPPPVPEPAVAPAKGKALFEQGEEMFNAKKWKEAIAKYSSYRDQNPKGKSYADATYKIGVCFHELGMKDEAKAFLEEVTAKFPGSKEAKKAAFRLKTLK